MTLSLPKCDEVAYFIKQATYLNLSGLLRSQNNVIPKDLTLAFIKGMSVNNYWTMCCPSVSGLRAHKKHRV